MKVVCAFCIENRGERTTATRLAPQFTKNAPNGVMWVPVCDADFEGWWEGSNVPEAQRPPAFPIQGGGG